MSQAAAGTCPRRMRLSEKPKGFSDKRLAVCCAHNLPATGGQIPHLQPDKCFLPRTCRGRKRIVLFLPPAGGKLCEAFFDMQRRRGHMPAADVYVMTMWSRSDPTGKIGNFAASLCKGGMRLHVFCLLCGCLTAMFTRREKRVSTRICRRR